MLENKLGFRPMNRSALQSKLLKWALSMAASVVFANSANAQSPSTAANSAISPADSNHSHVAAVLLRYPWNGANVWAGSSVETRNASHNEQFPGSLRVVGIQFTRDVWRTQRFRLSYVGEILPAMLVRSGAPQNRKPNAALNPVLLRDPAHLALYEFHDSYGFGLAPFGAEFNVRLTERVSALLNTTAGGALFSHVVPYGDCTKANFTVSPGAALQLEIFHRTAVAFGYTFHHLSNASLGASNPGMNSQIFFVRVAQLGARIPRN